MAFVEQKIRKNFCTRFQMFQGPQRFIYLVRKGVASGAHTNAGLHRAHNNGEGGAVFFIKLQLRY